MKIKWCNEILEVYAIEKQSENINYLVLQENIRGFVAINAKDCEIVDNQITTDDFKFKFTHNGFLLSREFLQDDILRKQLSS
ncbi:MAG: hypothetical protein J6M05_04630 [Cardiobacteriaceae bacterium]|nr:hypothetical protein [Cardiobacteriaceae bacterium]